MSPYQWVYGAEGSGLYFTITYDAITGELTVTSIEGSFDLNALWFSNGDDVVDGDTSLSKDEKSLNMNGSTTVWEDDGTSSAEKIVWDDYVALSDTGLGAEGETKATFISEGGSTTFDNFTLPEGWDPSTGSLGVRATSVNGEGSIKFADGEADTFEQLFFDNFSEYSKADDLKTGWGYYADLGTNGWSSDSTKEEIVD